jgi:hypothetical protein
MLYFPSLRKKKVPMEPVEPPAVLEDPIPAGSPQSDVSPYFPSMGSAPSTRERGLESVTERGLGTVAPSPYFPAIDTPEGSVEGTVVEAGAPKTLVEMADGAYTPFDFAPIDAALAALSAVFED